MSLVIHAAVSEPRSQRASCISPSFLLLTFLADNLRLYHLNFTSEDLYIFLLKTFSVADMVVVNWHIFFYIIDQSFVMCVLIELFRGIHEGQNSRLESFICVGIVLQHGNNGDISLCTADLVWHNETCVQ